MKSFLEEGLGFLVIVTLLVGCETVRRGGDATSVQVTATLTPFFAATGWQETAPASPTLTATTYQAPSPPPDIGLPREFLFEQQTPTCELPCWHDLRIGDSNPERIQSTFETVFHINKDLFSESSLEQGEVFEDVPGLTFASWGETVSQEPFQRFEVDVWITEEGHILQGISFRSRYEPYNTTLTLERVIQELGNPDYLYASIGDIGLTDYASIILLPVYTRGIAFMITMYVPILSREGDSIEIEYCLDSPYPRTDSDTAFLSIFTYAYLVASFQNIDNLDTLQGYLIGSEIESHEMEPFENSFGINIEQLQALIQDDNTLCLQGHRTLNDNIGPGA